MLTEDDLNRYSRQIIIPELGTRGQKKLKNSHVVVAGIGGLGSLSSMYLACAGIGHITIIDNDYVEISNLNRQVLHWNENIGEEKVLSAQKKMANLNPGIEITPVFEKVTENNAKKLIKGAQVVIDAMDNFETRFFLNLACVKEKIPFIHGGINGLFGEVTTIIPYKTPCLACIYPKVPHMEKPFPALGATASLIASIQVLETIKLIAGIGELITNRILYVDGTEMEFNFIEIKRSINCSVCGENENI
ncbi:MAG: HesA/MoeB/ThiF family protein [Thermodesulfobacteriota bacterium]|nr:HesA/MoeB/ThiF family protein [Thermodesulfobacteriota bacterium]